MALPRHVDTQLLASMFTLAGIDSNTVARSLERSGGNAQIFWDSITSKDLTDRQERALSLAENYITDLSGTNLKAFLVEGLNLPDSVVTRAISRASQDDTIGQVLQSIVSDNTQYVNRDATRQRLTSILTVNQELGFTGLDKSKRQYMNPADTSVGMRSPVKPSGTAGLTAGVRGGTQPVVESVMRGGKPKGLGGIMQKVGSGKDTKGGSIWRTLDTKLSRPGEPLGGTEGGWGDGGGETVAGSTADLSIPPLPPGASREDQEEYIRKYFGYFSWAMDIPELKDMLVEIAENPSGWDSNAIKGKLSQTNWWLSNGQNVATFLRRMDEDPITVQNEVVEQYQGIRDMMGKAGIEIPDDRVWAIAMESKKWGWSDQTLQAVIGSEYKFDPSKPTAITKELKQKASDYLVPLGDQAFGMWAKQIIAGEKTPEEYEAYLTQTAKSMFPHLSAQLDRGETLTQYFDHFKQYAAKTLELNPDTIKLDDPKWLKTLTRVDPKTGERGEMTLSEFDRLIKTDSQYGYEFTQQSHNEATNLYSVLSKKMGLT